tara:strand:+ start:1056 stop:1457 length:402 start_codon:yes stop_codon:yes gene_type:complete
MKKPNKSIIMSRNGKVFLLYRKRDSSKFDWASRTACLTLEQGCSIVLLKVSIRRTTLSALDVGIDIVGDGLLDSLWWDTTLESSTWSITRTRGTKFIENVLVDVVVISIHHRDNLVEITENSVLSFDEDLWRR